MKQLIKSETVRDRLDMPRSSFERLVKQGTDGFPTPVYISRSRFFNAADIDAWMTGLAHRAANEA